MQALVPGGVNIPKIGLVPTKNLDQLFEPKKISQKNF